MTKIATDFASKLAVALVAVAMVFTAFASTTNAQSSEDLQAMINDLLAQVAALQGQVSTGPSAGTCSSFLADLGQGTSNGEVLRLQQFLNMDPDTRVAAAGHAGSAGMETQYYGPATAGAVSKFQVKYRAEILSPLGLVNPTGYLGAGSRAKANALCSTPVVTPDTDTDTDTDTDEDDKDKVTLKGEASLTDFSVDDAQDSTLNEGDEDVEVAVMTVEFENGDASISRLDISLKEGSAQPWRVFESVSLWVDGDKVAESDADRKGDYLGDEADGVIRFSNLDIVAMSDEEVEITVAVTLQNSLKSDALSPNDWDVKAESVRFFDADGVATTMNAGSGTPDVGAETATFSIDLAGSKDSAEIKKDTRTPDAQSILVDDKTDTESHDIFLFGIEVDDESTDLELGKAYVDLTVTNPSSASTTIIADDVINRVYLTVDGKKVKGDTTAGIADTQLSHVIAASNDSNVLTYTFDFKGMALDADDLYDAVLTVEFKGQDNYKYQNGVTVSATVNGASWDVDGYDSNDVLKRTQSSKTMTLATVVPKISSVKSSITQANNQSKSGSIVFEFNVEADQDDVVITRAALDAVAALTSSASTSLAKPTPSLTKVSGDATELTANEWTIYEGENATFRLTYTLIATNASGHNDGNYSINLKSVGGEKVDETSPALPLAY